jgi:hypothetical protein
VDSVFVSTDDEEIANIGRDYGTYIINRPWQFATDTAANGAMVLDAIHTIWKTFKPEYVVMLYPTSPMIEGRHIDEAYKLLLSKGDAGDSICTMFKLNKTTDLGHFYIKTVDDQLVSMWGEHGAPPAIGFGLFPVYETTGAMVIWKITEDMFEGLPVITEESDEHQTNLDYANRCVRRDAKNLSNNVIKTIGYEIPEYVGWDINYPMDLVIAEAMLNYREHMKQICGLEGG